MDLRAIRDDFPITRQKFPVLGSDQPQPFVYLDHGASTHPPRPVLDAHRTFLERYYANIHRGSHHLSLIATRLFDDVAGAIADFIGADLGRNAIVLTPNTTGALDLASHIMGPHRGAVLTTLMEHHSNDLPHRRRGPVLHAAVGADGRLDMEDLERHLKFHQVKLVAVTGASNVTGLLPDIHRIAALAHAHGARILVDAAQLLAHHPLDVRPDDDPGHLDFVAAAGHKAYAPFGSAFLFGPRELMDAAEPYVPGGGTVLYVTPDDALWNRAPERHQGGTPNIAGAIALGAALQYLKRIGMAAVREHERALLAQALEGLSALEGVTLYGPPEPQERIGVISFNVEGLPHTLVAAILNYEGGIAVRNGCFCAHPYMHCLLGMTDVSGFRSKLASGEPVALPGAVRATFGLFNTPEEVGKLVEMVDRVARRRWRGDYTLDPGAICQPVQYQAEEAPPPGWLLSCP